MRPSTLVQIDDYALLFDRPRVLLLHNSHLLLEALNPVRRFVPFRSRPTFSFSAAVPSLDPNLLSEFLQRL